MKPGLHLKLAAAGAAVVFGAAPAAALSIVETARSVIDMNIYADTAGETASLVFDGFSGPGVLTGAVLRVNSSVFGEDMASGSVAIGLGAGSVMRSYSGTPFVYEAFDVATDLLATPNAFGASYAPGDFTGPTVTFDLTATLEGIPGGFLQLEWYGSLATLEYVYAAAVPLPAALPLMAAGLAGLAALGRRRG